VLVTVLNLVFSELRTSVLMCPQPICRNVKEEEGVAPAKGSNSLSGRELRALMRSNQEREAATAQDNKPGSTKGEPSHIMRLLARLMSA